MLNMRSSAAFLLLTLLTVPLIATEFRTCAKRKFGAQNIVCVCNASYCDYVGPIVKPGPKMLLIYTSNEAGLRFNKTSVFLRNTSDDDLGEKLVINHSEIYQNIKGFGGAFTDSAGINIMSLSNCTREHLLKSYFSENGIQYNLCRVPIGASDFSTRGYSYDDGDVDVALRNFKLAPEDYKYKIPLIKAAQNLTGDRLKLFSTAWTAPKWMKSNCAYAGFGHLKADMYQAWADYFVKFLDAYADEGLAFWGITTGNEPSNGFIPFNTINSVAWTSPAMSKWIAENLGPTLRRSRHSAVKLMVLDDQIFFLPWYVSWIFRNDAARKYVDGIALHWYWNYPFFRGLLTQTHQRFPDKFILSTEACTGSTVVGRGVKLGSWGRAEEYAQDIIQDLLRWVTGWVDWNMALDLEGGPTYIKNFVDSPIIVNASADEFYKQPTYYALGHFSKFITRGAVRIGVSHSGRLQVVALDRLDGATVIVILNKENKSTAVRLIDDTKGQVLIDITAKSVTTLIYW